MTASERGVIRSGGVDIVYEIAGAGESVVLLHGLGSSRRDWRPQVSAFVQRYRVVTLDLRGHGESGKPRGRYTMAQMGEDVATLIRERCLGTVHVVGLSLGGMVAFQLAVDHPEVVRSLTIVNSGPEVIPRTLRELLSISMRLLLTRLFGPARLAKTLSHRLFPKPTQERLRREFVADMAHNDSRAYLAVTRAIVGWSVADRLDRVECPVLVVSGDRDYTSVARKAEYVRRLKCAQLIVIADSGHATPVDRAEEFNAHVLQFLDGVTGPRDLSDVA